MWSMGMCGRRADARRQDDAAVVDGQVGVGRDQVDVAGLEAHPGLGLGHGQRRDPRQQFGQKALVSRRQMLHKEEGDVVFGRDVFEDFAEGFQAAGRAADADHEHGERRRRVLRWFGHHGLVGRLNHGHGESLLVGPIAGGENKG